MRINKIVASASRKVPHPVEEFGSLSALVSFEAEVAAGDDVSVCVVHLQGRAEEFVDIHLRKVSTQIAARHRVEQAAADAKKKTEGSASRLAAKHSKEVF